jgi:hypothetical protein
MTMRIDDLENAGRINVLKYAASDVPHATIETNRTCNIRCRNCYNLDRDGIKPLVAVKEEIDLVARKRNLQTISLLGGEPTLHPDLDKIIAYVKGKNLFCQVLTNGIRLLEDPGGHFLDRLVRAGLDRFLVHIDSGQSHVHGDIEKARRTLFEKLEAKRIPFSLSVTISNKDQGSLPGIVRRYSRYRYFDGILAVLARDALPPYTQNVQLEYEYRSLLSAAGLEPTGYVPSNVSEREVSWLVYSYFVNRRTGEVYSLSPSLERIYRNVYRLITGRHAFTIPPKPLLYELASAGVCLADAVFNPHKRKAFWRFRRGAGFPGVGKFQYLAIQTPPEFDAGLNRVRFCANCPDATIRNGRLTPVCLADFINPLNGSSGRRQVNLDWARMVYGEMGETGAM